MCSNAARREAIAVNAEPAPPEPITKTRIGPS
jgi:hypothetical protein